jgi:YidC/Oxa1 family membrane protein insertase
MDRKGITVVVLSLVTLVAWMYFNNQEMRRVAAAQAQAKAAAEVQAATAPETAPATAQETAPTAKSAEPAVPEQVKSLATESVDYTFTSLGGGIARALLKKHEAEHGTKMVLNEFGSIPIGALSEVAGEGTNVPFTAQMDAASGTITFDRTDARQLQLTKRFTVPQVADLKSDYVIQLEVTFTNRGAESLTVPAYFVHNGSAAQVHQNDLPNYTGFKWYGGKFIDANSFDGGWFHAARPVFAESHPDIAWAGVANQYFTTLVSPSIESPGTPAQSGQRGVAVWAKRFDITENVWTEAGHTSTNRAAKHYGINGALGMPPFTIEPGKSLTQRFQIYSGPREYARLREMPDGQVDVLGFSDVPGLFSFIGPFIGLCSKGLLFSLNTLHGWVGSYAIAIILLTLIIKSLLWPMQNKATRSMKRMQLLQPKMTELREKYKDDPTRMNTEVMKLYKEFGVNPLGGCLPMFVQIPIFFGFYNMLGKAVELRNTKFLWVHDLSQPDTIFHLPSLGWPVNILPLCMAGTMFWQMSISPKSGDAAQQRIFMFMPLIFVAFCYNFASALALYWTVQNLFSVTQLYATRNQAPPTLEKVTAPRKRK